jgi:hypothetical protein
MPGPVLQHVSALIVREEREMMAQVWQIRVRGHLGPQWREWFEGLTIINIERGQEAQAILSGPLADQAALHGVLTKVRDLGLPLLAVSRVADDDFTWP